MARVAHELTRDVHAMLMKQIFRSNTNTQRDIILGSMPRCDTRGIVGSEKEAARACGWSRKAHVMGAPGMDAPVPGHGTIPKQCL